jgi:hypothetical protein
MAEMLGIPGPGESVTTTTSQPVSSTHADWSKKEMSPETRAQMRAWLDAEDAREAAMKSAAPTVQKTPEEIEAEVKSRDNSREALERADVAAQPDPFQPPAGGVGPVPTLMGRPPMAPQMEQAKQVSRPYTSQEFSETPEMKGPQTFEAAQDEARAYEAQAKGRLAKEQADKLAAIQAKREADQQAALERINTASEEFAQRQAELFEKPSAWRTVLGAIAQGLGAYGAGLTRGPNYAYEIIKSQQDHDMQLKKVRVEAALAKMKAAGASLEQIDAYAKAAQERMMAQQKAQIDVVTQRASQMLAPFPQAQRKWAEEAAKLKTEQAEKVAKFVQESTGMTSGGGSANEGVKQSTTTGSKTGTTEGRAKGAQQAAVARVQGEHAERLEKIIDESPKNFPDPSQIRKIQDNTNALIRQQRLEEHSALQSLFGQALRGLREKGIADFQSVPSSIFDNTGMTDKQKEAWTLHVLSAHTQSINEAGTGFLSNDISRDAIFSPRVAQPNDPHSLNLEKVRNGIQFAKTTAQMVEDASREGHRAKVVEESREAAKERAGNAATTKPAARPTPEQRSAYTYAKQVLKFQDKAPPEKVKKAKALVEAYEKNFGGR